MQEYAPVVNKGYYDVPIHNEFSNTETRDSVQYMDQYRFNKDINTTINDNDMNIRVQSHPTVPSNSLYFETDQSMSPYYQRRLIKKKEYDIEQFSNEVQDYLNVQSIPNASCAYLPNFAYFSPLTAPASPPPYHLSPEMSPPPRANPPKKTLPPPEKEKQVVMKKSSKKQVSQKKEMDVNVSQDKEINMMKENIKTMNYICIILVLIIVLLILYILCLNKNIKL
jgi:hypothetical protein